MLSRVRATGRTAAGGAAHTPEQTLIVSRALFAHGLEED